MAPSNARQARTTVRFFSFSLTILFTDYAEIPFFLYPEGGSPSIVAGDMSRFSLRLVSGTTTRSCFTLSLIAIFPSTVSLPEAA